MIPRDYVTEWRQQAPWVQDSQVEQDLILSRALVEIPKTSTWYRSRRVRPVR